MTHVTPGAPWPLRALAFLFLAAAAPSPTLEAQGAPVPSVAPAKALREIHALFDEYEDAFNLRAVYALAELHAEDYEGVNLFGQRVRGRAEWRSRQQYMFDGLSPAASLRLEPSVRLVRPDVAIADGTWQLLDGPADQPATGSFLTVLERTGDRWRVASGLHAPRIGSTRMIQGRAP